MSNVSSYHSIQKYTGTEKALSGQRLITVTFKTDKVTGIKPESKCASIPFAYDQFGAEILENWQLVERHVISMFEKVQDAIVRESVVDCKTQVHAEEIGLFACLDYMKQEQAGGRLSKEVLTTFFTEEVEPALTVVLGEKLGVVNNSPSREQEKIITTSCQRFLMWITSLAGTKTLFDDNTISQVEKCLAFAANSTLKDKLLGKLEDMKKQNQLVVSGVLL